MSRFSHRAKTLLVLLVTGLVLLPACSKSTSPTPNADSSATDPLLSSLSLASYELTPAFSPSIHDYTISCAENSRISLRHTTSTDAVLSLTPEAPVSLSPGALLTVDVSSPGRSASYRVRCLPTDFPDLEVRGTPGVWIQTVLPARGARASYLVLLDEHGTPVFYHRYKSSPPFVSYLTYEALPRSVKENLRQESDALLEIPLTYDEFGPFSQHQGTVVTLRSIEGEVLRTWNSPEGVAIDHHDAAILPSGNLLVISYQETTPPSGIASAPFAASHPVFGEPDCLAGPFDAATDNFMDSVILEVTPTGSVVRTYSLKELLGASAISFPIRFDTDQKVGSANCVFDAYHANALELTSSGEVLVSGLAMDGVVLIDLETSRAAYRLGGPSNASSLTIKGDPLGGLSRIHDGRFTQSGLLSVFDNRIAHLTDRARGVLYQIDRASRTATFVSSFETSCDGPLCASQWGGSFRVADNGSIVLAAGGRENGPSIEVLAASGKLVASVVSSSVYRAVPVYPRLKSSELAGLTTKLNSAPVTLDGSCSTDYFGTCR